jgi:hypothetical protein
MSGRLRECFRIDRPEVGQALVFWGNCSMSGFVVVLSLVLTLAQPRPEDLVAQLGATKYSDRQAASAALLKIGRRAVPALKAAKDHPDAEVRNRVEILLTSIEGSLLLQATTYSLNFKDRPLSEIVSELNKISPAGFSIWMDDKGAANRKISMKLDEPVPFWTAVDKICDAGGLEYAFVRPQTNPGQRDTSMALSVGDTRPAGLMSDSGPFRVNLMSLHYQRDVTYATSTVRAGIMPGGVGGQVPSLGLQKSEQFYVRLQAVAEPHLTITQVGPPTLSVATDDRGNSMLLPVNNTLNPMMGMMNGFGGQIGPLQFQVSLKRPENAGKLVRLIRGKLPVTVASRKPDALEISIANEVGKTVKNEDSSLTIHEMKTVPTTNQTSIELTVVALNPRGQGDAVDDPFTMSRPDMNQSNLEVLDGKGKPIGWYVSMANMGADGTRMTLTTIGGGPGLQAKPEKIRYHAMVRTVTEIPFEFKDVLMP